MLIYKIFRAREWAELSAAGHGPGAPIDIADGFIHFSTAEQLSGTLAKHFAGERDLVIAAIDPETCGPDLRWEPARGGALFAHLYREIAVEDILWTRRIADAANPPDDLE